MQTEQLLKLLRPMIGFRGNDLDVDEQVDKQLTPELKATSTGLTLDQCHEVLQLQTLVMAYRKNLKNFPAYLVQTRDDAIRALLDTLDTKFTEAGLTARLMGPATFPQTVLSGTIILKAGRRVGLLIRPTQTDVVAFIVRLKLSTLGSLANPLTLTLQQEGIDEPIGTITLPTANTWTDITLPELTKDVTYYLTYAEDDLGNALAQNTLAGWPKPKRNCVSCQKGCLSHYLQSKAVAFGADGSGQELTDTNFGLSLLVTVNGDVSGRLVDNPRRLLSALKQQMAVTFLNKIAYSTRLNGQAEEAMQSALFALTDKDNADRVPLLLDRAISAVVKGLQAEASAALDVNDADDVTWNSL